MKQILALLSVWGLLLCTLGSQPVYAQAEQTEPAEQEVLTASSETEAQQTPPAEEPDTTRKVVWDINIRTNPQDLLIHLKAIRDTYDTLVGQALEPDMIFLFRGQSMTWLAQNRRRRSGYSQDVIQEIVTLVADFQKRRGVRMEADVVARELISEEAKRLLPGITPIKNSFVALINYQTQGYSMISLY